jgi:hypothetical protein
MSGVNFNDTTTKASTTGGGGGDVAGPATATDNALVRFNGTTGKLIQNSAATLSDAGALDTANVTADYFQIDTAATPPTLVAGTMAWDDGNGTSELGLKGGNVTLRIGEQQYARVYNDTLSTITKGQVVYISGAQGNRVAVKLAQANTEATSKDTIGLAAENIASGAEGWVINAGSLYSLNTNTLTAGQTIYLSPTTAGAYTTTKPVAPQQTVILGFVQRVSATVGSLYLKVDNGYELDELHDVFISSPSDGQLLIRDQAAGVWENANLTAGTGMSITNGAGSISLATTITQYTDELAQDAVGAMVDSTLVYTDATPLLSRAALTGDVTATAGSNATTIPNDTVTYAKMQNVSATDRLLGRSTAGAGDVEEITCTAAGRALIDDADASAQRITLGLGSLATQSGTFSGIFSGTSSGVNTGDQTITLTGDVTGSGNGSFAATVAANVITNAKLAQVATATFKGRTTASTGNVEDLTVTQATALLNTFTTSLKGLAPSSGGGTTNFLRADGTWAAPGGGGSSKTIVSVQTANYTAANNQIVPANTTSGSFTVTLAPSPTAGTIVQIFDYLGTWGTNGITVGRNSVLINGVAADFTSNVPWASYIFLYIDATIGYRVFEGVTI